MNERENIARLMGEVLDLCHEISTYSKADCFFNYSPHVDCFDVQVFEFGWAEGAKGEWYVFSEKITRENLFLATKKLLDLRVKLGGDLWWKFSLRS